jgi:hypothetical protein
MSTDVVSVVFDWVENPIEAPGDVLAIRTSNYVNYPLSGDQCLIPGRQQTVDIIRDSIA